MTRPGRRRRRSRQRKEQAKQRAGAGVGQSGDMSPVPEAQHGDFPFELAPSDETQELGVEGAAEDTLSPSPSPETALPAAAADEKEPTAQELASASEAPITYADHDEDDGEDLFGPNLEPSAEDLLFNAAREAAQNREARRAVSIYRELLAVNPEHLSSRINLALLLEQMGALDEALTELGRCRQIEADDPSILVTRGAVLGGHGRYNEAEQDLRRALELEPTNVEAHFNLGLLKSRRGLWSDALPFLRRSVELDPSRAEAYLYLGDALNHVDDLHGALQAYHRSVELGPNNGRAFYGLGMVYDRLNQPQEAAKMYRRSRELKG